MDLKIAARMLAVFALGGAMIAAVTALKNETGPEEAPSLRLRDPGGEPIRNGLARCRDMGVTAADDAACLKTWAESRRRFFQTGKPEKPAVPKGDTGVSPPKLEKAPIR